jgi:nicotinamidase-related amidase
MSTVLLVVGGLVVVFAALIGCGLLQLTATSKGPPIERPDGPAKRALLVVDAQRVYLRDGPRAPYPNAVRVRFLEGLNRALEEAQRKDMLVVYVRHAFAGPLQALLAFVLLGGRARSGDPDNIIDPRVLRVSSHVFEKHAQDAFSCEALDAFLRAQGITEVAIAGLDGAACVQRTARGALQRGYAVTFVEDAIATSVEGRWTALLDKLRAAGARTARSAQL